MEWMILPFRRYADFDGRSRRREFWMFQLLNLIVGTVLAGPFFFNFLSAAVAAGDGPDADTRLFEALFNSGFTLPILGVTLYGLYGLAAFIPSIALSVRRLHDRDMSGWWYLGLSVGSAVPVVGGLASIALFVLMLLPGTDGSNRFGPDPKNPYGEDLFA